MKAIILCAGKGERLKSVVTNVPKPMVKIKGKPIIHNNIEWLRDWGVTSVYINLHYLPNVIKNYFGNGKHLGVTIKYSYEKQLFGTAGAVKKIANEFWKEKYSSFIILYGDNLFQGNLKKIIDFHKEKKGIATIALHTKKDVSQSGIVILDNNHKIIRFIEKPKQTDRISNLVNASLYVCEKRVLSYIPVDTHSDFGNDIFPNMIKKKEKIYGSIFDGSITAIDTPEFYRKAIGDSL